MNDLDESELWSGSLPSNTCAQYHMKINKQSLIEYSLNGRHMFNAWKVV